MQIYCVLFFLQVAIVALLEVLLLSLKIKQYYKAVCLCCISNTPVCVLIRHSIHIRVQIVFIEQDRPLDFPKLACLFVGVVCCINAVRRSYVSRLRTVARYMKVIV